MLSEILFVVLVLVVAVLMAVDLARTRRESPHAQADRQAHSTEPVVAVPSRGFAAGPLSQEPARAAPFFPEASRAASAASAPAAGLPPGEAAATRSFDQIPREMARSTANEAELHEKLNAIFVNLSHRSQSLVERQLRLIGDLEHGEQDPLRRANLSKLNRIAMRMHRNSQNLLVMAGHRPSSGWNKPVTLVQLVDAALAEVEDGERVSAQVQPDIAVRGPAVNDLVHLLVELIENATSFSAAEMSVQIKGHILTSGGALVEITDRGIGMTAKDMAYANQELDNPPPADTDVPRRMGLLVVARLAAEHGIRVRLNQAEFGGLTALVWLPDQILTHYSSADPGHGAEQRGVAVSPAAHAPVRMNTPDAPAARTDLAWSASSAQATVPVEPVAAARVSAAARPDVPGGDVGMVVHGPPIFDEVESRWSQDGRQAPSSPGLTATASPVPAGLPKRPTAAPAGPRTASGATPGAPNRSATESRQGWAAPAEEINSGAQDES
jgi:signal transduction histidine kinase